MMGAPFFQTVIYANVPLFDYFHEREEKRTPLFSLTTELIEFLF